MAKDPIGTPYTTTQLAAHWLLAGGNDTDLEVALAVAIAESSLRNAMNCSEGETPPGQSDCCSVGPWQINWCPGREGFSRDALLDPAFNARIAVSKRKTSRGFNHWTQFRNEAYVKHLDDPGVGSAVRQVTGKSEAELRELAAVPGANEGVIPEIIPGVREDIVTNPLQALGDFFAALLRPETWVRVLQVVMGAIGIIVGVWIIVQDLDIQQVRNIDA